MHDREELPAKSYKEHIHMHDREELPAKSYKVTKSFSSPVDTLMVRGTLCLRMKTPCMHACVCICICICVYMYARTF